MSAQRVEVDVAVRRRHPDVVAVDGHAAAVIGAGEQRAEDLVAGGAVLDGEQDPGVAVGIAVRGGVVRRQQLVRGRVVTQALGHPVRAVAHVQDRRPLAEDRQRRRVAEPDVTSQSPPPATAPIRQPNRSTIAGAVPGMTATRTAASAPTPTMTASHSTAACPVVSRSRLTDVRRYARRARPSMSHRTHLLRAGKAQARVGPRGPVGCADGARQPLLRHADAPDGGDARRHRRGRGRRRAARRGPDDARPRGARRGAAGPRGGVFLPSGTMCNEIAIRLHIRPGGERMFIGRDTHTLIAEAGGPAQLSGAVITEVDGDSGMFTAAGARARHPRLRARRALRAARAPGVRRADDEHGRRARVAARAGARRARRRPRVGPRDPPRRRAADERGRGQRRRRRRLGERLRQRVAGLHQGPRRPGRRVPGRLGGLHRGGVALEADARRRHAPVGHRRRGRASTRSTTTSSAWPTTTRAPGAWPRASPRCPASSSTPPPCETNIVIFAVPDAAAFTAALAAEDVEMSHFGPTRVRAVTHLDVDDAGIDRHWRSRRRRLG